MVIVRFRFPAGRYHATPWGAHVNEGVVEWPPSPWRILRAMLAVGFARLGWSEVPIVARSLIEKLASVVPTVHLPPANGAHTRHYMPVFNGSTTRVFDAFAWVGDAPLAFEWDTALEPKEEELLEQLLEAMPYLGRAESWVEASRVQHVPPDLEACIASDACPGPRYERVARLAPESPSAYAYWRASAFEHEAARKLRERVSATAAKGKPAPKALSKKELADCDALFPKTVVDVLLADTRQLQVRGWSQPPGTRWLSYWRPVHSLRAAVTPSSSRTESAPPTTALLALASDTKHGERLPPLKDALWRMEMIHDALVRLSAADDSAAAAVFSGMEDGVPLKGHRHALLVPLTLDRRSDRIDHVLVYAKMGFDARARAALGALSKTYAKNAPTIFVSLAGVGQLEDFEPMVPLLRASTRFRSVTPFVPPRFVKARGKNSLLEQVQSELEHLGVARAARVEVLPERICDFRTFRKARRDPRRAPPMRLGVGLEIEFTEPVHGPIAIGYASHFGLGVLAPESPSSAD